MDIKIPFNSDHNLEKIRESLVVRSVFALRTIVEE